MNGEYVLQRIKCLLVRRLKQTAAQTDLLVLRNDGTTERMFFEYKKMPEAALLVQFLEVVGFKVN